MKYEDLKYTFTFKTQEGKSALTYTADKKSKHIWIVLIDYNNPTAEWDCEDMLEHFNSGAWVVQDEDQIEETREVQVQEQVQEVPEVKTLRDELIIAVLPTVCTNLFNEQNFAGDWPSHIAKDTLAIVDSVLKARKESL